MGYWKVYSAGNVSIATNTNLLLPFLLTDFSAAPAVKLNRWACRPSSQSRSCAQRGLS